MVTCACGHGHDDHQDGTGRCQGQSTDPHGRYSCVCPYYTQEKL